MEGKIMNVINNVINKTLKDDLVKTIKVWPTVSKVIRTLHNDEEYNKAIGLLDELIYRVKEKKHPILESLIDTLGTLIKDYEDRNIKEPQDDPIGNLKYLMNEHNLKQSDLNEIGSQGVVSEILNGKRQLNMRQIKLLGKRFRVSTSVFI